jgi:hypothetical protein
VTGTLGLFSLTDLFQLLASSGRTGRLAVHHPAGLARIYFDKGRVVYADFGGQVGEEAVFALFADERGSFEFQLGLPAPGVSISGPTEMLLMDVIRRLDESSKGVSPIPESAVPILTEGASASRTLGLEGRQLEVLKYVNGKYEVGEIAELAKLPADATREVLGKLLEAGVIRLSERKVRTARLVVQLSRRPLPPGAVGVDAQICAAWRKALGQMPRKVACRRPDGRIDTFALHPADQVGPYVLVARDTLLRSDLSAGTPLLVRPLNTP